MTIKDDKHGCYPLVIHWLILTWIIAVVVGGCVLLFVR